MSAAWYRAERRAAHFQIVVGLVLVCAALAFVDWRVSLGFFGLYVLTIGLVRDVAVERQQRGER